MSVERYDEATDLYDGAPLRILDSPSMADLLVGGSGEVDYRIPGDREAVAIARRRQLEAKAQQCLEAALANVRPHADYADITARVLAREAVEYALGLKELPADEGEQ